MSEGTSDHSDAGKRIEGKLSERTDIPQIPFGLNEFSAAGTFSGTQFGSGVGSEGAQFPVSDDEAGKAPIHNWWEPLSATTPLVHDVRFRDAVRLEEVVGNGGMKRVWKGVHLPTADVAVKEFKTYTPEWRARSALLEKIAENEVRISQRLRGLPGEKRRYFVYPEFFGHAEMIDMEGIWVGRGQELVTPYILTEYFPKTLGDIMQSMQQGKTLQMSPEVFTFQLISDLCTATQIFHELGIVHRDLKPANVFLTAEGKAKVGDFGIAIDAETPDSIGLQCMGSLSYMAPEQLLGKPPDAQADLFALGVILYELMGGLPLEQRTITTRSEIMGRIMEMWEQEQLPTKLGGKLTKLPETWGGATLAYQQEPEKLRSLLRAGMANRVQLLPGVEGMIIRMIAPLDWRYRSSDDVAAEHQKLWRQFSRGGGRRARERDIEGATVLISSLPKEGHAVEPTTLEQLLEEAKRIVASPAGNALTKLQKKEIEYLRSSADFLEAKDLGDILAKLILEPFFERGGWIRELPRRRKIEKLAQELIHQLPKWQNYSYHDIQRDDIFLLYNAAKKSRASPYPYTKHGLEFGVVSQHTFDTVTLDERIRNGRSPASWRQAVRDQDKWPSEFPYAAILLKLAEGAEVPKEQLPALAKGTPILAVRKPPHGKPDAAPYDAERIAGILWNYQGSERRQPNVTIALSTDGVLFGTCAAEEYAFYRLMIAEPDLSGASRWMQRMQDRKLAEQQKQLADLLERARRDEEYVARQRNRGNTTTDQVPTPLEQRLGKKTHKFRAPFLTAGLLIGIGVGGYFATTYFGRQNGEKNVLSEIKEERMGGVGIEKITTTPPPQQTQPETAISKNATSMPHQKETETTPEIKVPKFRYEVVTPNFSEPRYVNPDDLFVHPKYNRLFATYTEGSYGEDNKDFVVLTLSRKGAEEVFRYSQQAALLTDMRPRPDECMLSGIDEKGIMYILCEYNKEILLKFSLKTKTLEKVGFPSVYGSDAVTDPEGYTFLFSPSVDVDHDFYKSTMMHLTNVGVILQEQDMGLIRSKETPESNFVDIATVNGKGLYVLRDNGVMVYNRQFIDVLSFGGVGDEPGKFHFPMDIAVDSKGDIYIADTSNHRVQIFNPKGSLLGIIGSYGTAPGQFDTPTKVAVDSQGNLYVVDSGNKRIQQLRVTLPETPQPAESP